MTWREFCINELGYEPKTTFWNDFSIAEGFGNDAIKDTFNRAFAEWKSDHIYLTELAMVLSHKGGLCVNKNKERARLYFELYSKVDIYAVSNLKGDELQYYYQTLD